MNQQRDDYEAVRHLFALGYTDPDETALREAAVRRQLEAELQIAVQASKQGRTADAISLLERLKVDDPDWIAPHQYLAEIQYFAGRWREAQAELEWLEHHAVEHPQLSQLAAGIAVRRRDFATALELLEYAAHVDPALSGVFSLLGAVLLRFGQWELSREAFQRALEKNATDARALDGMAALCLRDEEPEEAANWALSAVESDMQLSRAHYHLGLALSKMGRPIESLTALETFSRMEPTCAAVCYWMSRVATQAWGDDERATKYRAIGRERVNERRQQRRRAKHHGAD